MQTFRIILAIVGLIVAIYLLIKKRDTKTVLIGVGLVLCVLCLNPLGALNAFTASMTKAALIKAICASMGFAFVMKYTGCDRQFVLMLTKPLRNVGFILIPLAVAITFFINIAIPSAAGCAAAVGATMIPLLMSAGVRPEMAASAVFCGTFGSLLSPGLSHNAMVTAFVQKTNPAYTIPDVIQVQFPSAMAALAVAVVGISMMALFLKDFQKGTNFNLANNTDKKSSNASDEKINFLHAIMPIIPLLILVIGGVYTATHPELKGMSVKPYWVSFITMGVAEAMLLGAVITIIVTLTNPEKITKEFFSGMGSGYANIMGIIIAAGVFVAGLKACGAIDLVIEWLKNEKDYAIYGGTFIPFLMGLITGSGDAATMAFNEAITSRALELGFEQDKLGMAATIAGALGRTCSPIAGAAIVCAGIAGINPVEMVKRTAPGMVVALLVVVFVVL